MGRFLFLFLLAVLTTTGLVSLGRQTALNLWIDTWPPERSVTVLPAPDDCLECEARVSERSAIAHEVLAGRMSLPLAATEFHRLNGSRTPNVLGTAPGCTTEEKLCRQVIRYVETLESEYGMPRAVSEALHAELAARLADGRLVGMIVPTGGPATVP